MEAKAKTAMRRSERGLDASADFVPYILDSVLLLWLLSVDGQLGGDGLHSICHLHVALLTSTYTTVD